jgi:hypothetical protein
VEDLLFHSSYDWLMPVVEKIEGFGVSVLIGRFFCEINYTSAYDESVNFEIRYGAGVKLNAIHGALVEFIKFYTSPIK